LSITTAGDRDSPQDLRHQNPIADLERRPQKVAEPPVLGLEGGKLLQAALEHQVIPVQDQVLLA
jgi:hypothetical protein